MTEGQPPRSERCDHCGRCGGGLEWADCPNCEDGYSHHDCGEDSCACLDKSENVPCDWCRGKGGSWHCANTPEWCNANPLPGCENVPSTALTAEAWND